jgi:hypothetical protein
LIWDFSLVLIYFWGGAKLSILSTDFFWRGFIDD